MSSAGPREDGSLIALGGTLVAFAGVGVVWSAAALAAHAAGSTITPNPFGFVLGLVVGRSSWPAHATWYLAGELAVLAAAITSFLVCWWRRRGRRQRPDRAARDLAGRRDLAHLGPRAVAASAARLRPGGAAAEPAEHGVAIGATVPGGLRLRSSWEDTLLLVAGPRVGKSTSYVIPAVCDAPGAVLVTSNKRDVHDATREVRAARGRVWNFDPQGVVGGNPAFWFDPLAGVDSITAAKTLTSHFVTGTRSATARTDAYFDVEGERLLAALLLAAARARGSILDAYRWLTNPYDTSAADTLRAAGDDLVAARLRAIQQAPDKQRDGVYGTALSLTGCLEDPAVARWVTPPSIPLLRFVPASFAVSTDTLYSHSREGEGSAGPLVAALTQAVHDAAATIATTRPGARLDPPLLSVLDEAANVCRLRHLPDNYSHFGSRGLPVFTVLQSWEQGVDVWGRSGMKKLWDTANVRIYGGGVADADFLDMLSRLIGDRERRTVSHSVDHRGQRSRSFHTRPERIFDAAALASLPRGRAVVLASGTPAALVAPTPWMVGPHESAIRVSLARHDPATPRSTAADGATITTRV